MAYVLSVNTDKGKRTHSILSLMVLIKSILLFFFTVDVVSLHLRRYRNRTRGIVFTLPSFTLNNKEIRNKWYKMVWFCKHPVRSNNTQMIQSDLFPPLFTALYLIFSASGYSYFPFFCKIIHLTLSNLISICREF